MLMSEDVPRSDQIEAGADLAGRNGDFLAQHQDPGALGEAIHRVQPDQPNIATLSRRCGALTCAFWW